jgi:hypothetical protein
MFPSIAHPITSASHGPHPSKRTKFSPSTPNTIADRLSQGFYTSFTTVLSDVGFVRCELLALAEGTMGNGLLTNGAGPVTGGTPLVAQILYFKESSKEIITRERVRRVDIFDFVKEMAGIAQSRSQPQKVELIVWNNMVLSFLPYRIWLCFRFPPTRLPRPGRLTYMSTPRPNHHRPRPLPPRRPPRLVCRRCILFTALWTSPVSHPHLYSEGHPFWQSSRNSHCEDEPFREGKGQSYNSGEVLD